MRISSKEWIDFGSTHTQWGEAAFSYLLPLNSHVIWWLALMGNGWNPPLSSSLIVSTVNGATVKIRWCHRVRSPPTATIQHLTRSASSSASGWRAKEGEYQEEVWRNFFLGRDIFTACDGFQLMGGAPLVSASYSSLSAAALRPPLRVIFLHQMTTGEILGSIMRTLLWPKFHCFPGRQQL